jgi:uncharacterized protein (TIGR03000 family)
MKKHLWVPAVMMVLFLHGGAAEAQFRFRPRPVPPPLPPWFYIVPIMQNENDAPRQVVYPPPSTNTLPEAKENRAVIQILLPSTANDIWVDGTKMTTRLSASRVFISPPLEPGHNYTYTVRADWPGTEGMVSQERPVILGANRTVTVDFNRPAPVSETPKEKSTGK